MGKASLDRWQIIYNDFSGVEANAVKFLSGELCKTLAREAGVYTLYVIPCVSEAKRDLAKNAIVVSVYNESKLAKKYVASDEISENGWIVRSVKEGDVTLIIITAKKKENLYFAATSFTDEFMVKFAPKEGNFTKPDAFFEYEIGENTLAIEPKTETRSVFTWAHPINDYRSYIRSVARVKINRIIFWNDYAPVNAREVVDYAHGYGVKLVWGFAWGWIDGCDKINDISDERLSELKKQILERYDREYSGISEDGIYFQSFTEYWGGDEIGGVRISEAVVKLVNATSAALLEKYPNLNIVFGLHATSVKKHLDDIEKTDRRIEILWEDFGAFPSEYKPAYNKEEYDELVATTEKILALRGGEKVGFLLKGFMTLDWTRFKYQSGPYILGENGKEAEDNDFALRSDAWRIFQAGWIAYGDKALGIARLISEKSDGKAEVGLVGCFDGGMWATEALGAEIIVDPFREYADILKVALSKKCVRFA